MDSINQIQAPDTKDLKSVAEKHNLHISDEDLAVFAEYYGPMFDAVYGEINKLPDQTLPVKYRYKFRRPTEAENPYNAWAWITDSTGSGAGKLSGKILAVKDNMSMAGVPLTNGSSFMEGFTADHNATVIERILDEGGVIKGRATCDDMCSSGTGMTSVTGPVLNPCDVTRMTGGSSAGCAALIASGEIDMAVGTDNGGSIRVPCSWCGIVGLKPTFGLVPFTGILSISSVVDFVGPMAKTVRDCALLLEVISGSDGLDPRQPTDLKSKNYTETLNGTMNLKDLRIGMLKEGFEGAEMDVNDLVRSATNKLTTCGATVTEFSSDLHSRAGILGVPIIAEGNYANFSSFGVDTTSKGHKDVHFQDFFFSTLKAKSDLMPNGLKGSLLLTGYVKEKYGSLLCCHFYAKATNAMKEIVKGFDELFKQYDVIVMPTTKYKAPKIPQEKWSLKATISKTPPQHRKASEYLRENLRMTENTFPYNSTGHPALSVNVGHSEGLPVGMMIVGPHWGDDLVLRVGHHVEQLVYPCKNN